MSHKYLEKGTKALRLSGPNRRRKSYSSQMLIDRSGRQRVAKVDLAYHEETYSETEDRFSYEGLENIKTEQFDDYEDDSSSYDISDHLQVVRVKEEYDEDDVSMSLVVECDAIIKYESDHGDEKDPLDLSEGLEPAIEIEEADEYISDDLQGYFTYCDPPNYIFDGHNTGGKNPYKCNCCNYSTKSRHFLQRHLKLHAGKMYPCDQCDFTAAQKSILLYHKMAHSEEKRFACDQCDYKTEQSCRLQYHKRTHTGEKPYACDLCDFRCARRSNLTLHKRRHTGERPFACEWCTYRASSSSSLIRHKKIHLKRKMLTGHV